MLFEYGQKKPGQRKTINVKLMFGCRIFHRRKKNEKKNKLARALWFLFFSCPCFLFLLVIHEYYILVTACYACQRIIYCFQRFFTPAYKIPITFYIKSRKGERTSSYFNVYFWSSRAPLVFDHQMFFFSLLNN